MKKGLIAAALGCALFSISSQADTIAGVYVGAQVWQTDTQGGFADTNNTADFNFDDETNTTPQVFGYSHWFDFQKQVTHHSSFLPNMIGVLQKNTWRECGG